MVDYLNMGMGMGTRVGEGTGGGTGTGRGGGLPFPVWVLECRARHGETQVQFAERVGCRWLTVHRWERDGRVPREALRRALREAGTGVGMTTGWEEA